MKGIKERSRKKYYAVSRGHVPGIYRDWESCKKQTTGYTGARFKGFQTMEGAIDFMYKNHDGRGYSPNMFDRAGENNEPILNGERTPAGVTMKDLNIMIEEMVIRKMKEMNLTGNSAPSTNNKGPEQLLAEQVTLDLDPPSTDENKERVPYVAYVDGGYYMHQKVVGYAAIIFNDKHERTQISAATNDERYIPSHNVSGELLATKVAILHAITHGATDIHIYHDYEGIAKWATDEWQAKTPISIEYKEFIKTYKDKINIEFTEVKSHSGVLHNEEVDMLVKNAIREHIRFHS